MPIVLAIEPDRRQAAHLTAIVRHLVGAELVLANTTEGALDAIGDLVPDLVLVPALLSPQDDAALAAALRVIAAAAHVRTLTIPVLASGAKRAAPAGILAKWRRSRAASPEPDGCDPAVFGEQIAAYLHEAASDRAELEEEPLDVRPAAADAIASEPVVAIAPPAPRSPVEQPVMEPIVVESIEPPVAEPVQHWAAEENDPAAVIAPSAQLSAIGESAMESIEPPAAEPVPSSDAEDAEPLIDLSEELAGLADEAGDELFDGERVGVYTISVEADEPDVEAFDLLQAILEPPAIARPAAPIAVAEPEEFSVEELSVEEPAVEAFDLPQAMLEPAAIARDAAARMAEAQPDEPFVEPAEPPRADIEPWVPMYLTPGRLWPALEGMPAETPAPRTEQPDWIELVASLRQDLERRRAESAPAPADPVAARPSDGGEAEARRLVKKQKPHVKKSKPVQDEWGFFDPEQCGFSTLLAKLEEITEEVVGG